MKKVIIFSDGGSRGNPGPAATGVVIKDTTGTVLTSYGEYLGIQTNNFAEYSALISGLIRANTLGATEVVCYVDSLLVEKQLNKEWRVKEPTIQKLFVKAWNAMQEFDKVTIRHTLREGNKEADAEVNKTLDAHAK